MNKIMILLSVCVLAACSTGKKGVNEPKVQAPPEVFGIFGTSRDNSQYGGNKPAAIAGKVVLESQMQRPLAGIRVGVFRKTGIEWRHITEFTSNSDGTFSINKGLEPGDYELRINSPKYDGKLAFVLIKPDLDLIIPASEK